MHKMLKSLIDHLFSCMYTAVPKHKDNCFLSKLLKVLFSREDEALYKAALTLEQSKASKTESQVWEDAFGNDGLEYSVWDPDQSITPERD